MRKTLDTTLHKASLYYQHGQLRQENLNQNWYKYKNFSDNCKPRCNPQPYRKKNNNFQVNKNFNKPGTKNYVLAANVNRPIASGANDTPLQIKCQKCGGPHYAKDFKNKKDGVLHNLKEEPNVEDIAGTPQIYAALDG